MSFSRRAFLATTAAATAVVSAPKIHAASKDKKYRTALIGSGWWGMNILREALAAGQTKVVALCDVDQDRLAIAAEEVTDLCGDEPKIYSDFRELFNKEEVESAIIAPPDHWHALNTLARSKLGRIFSLKSQPDIRLVRVKRYSRLLARLTASSKLACIVGLGRIMFRG